MPEQPPRFGVYLVHDAKLGTRLPAPASPYRLEYALAAIVGVGLSPYSHECVGALHEQAMGWLSPVWRRVIAPSQAWRPDPVTGQAAPQAASLRKWGWLCASVAEPRMAGELRGKCAHPGLPYGWSGPRTVRVVAQIIGQGAAALTPVTPAQPGLAPDCAGGIRVGCQRRWLVAEPEIQAGADDAEVTDRVSIPKSQVFKS